MRQRTETRRDDGSVTKGVDRARGIPNWTETWRIDAKRSGSDISGPVKFVRHYLADTASGAKKWTTVVWKGTLEASIADDGSLSGAVNGQSVDGNGGVHPLKWKVKGVRSR